MSDINLNWELGRILLTIEGFEELGASIQRLDSEAIALNCDLLIKKLEPESQKAAITELKSKAQIF